MNTKLYLLSSMLLASSALVDPSTAVAQVSQQIVKGTNPITLSGASLLPSATKRHSGQPRLTQRLGENSPILPPFVEPFDYRDGMEHEDFDRNFQTIDVNNDRRVWGMYAYQDDEYSRCAYMHFPIDQPQADDWLITRAIKLKAGKWYCVHVDASLFKDGEAHKFEVKYGMFNDVDGLDTQVIPPTEVSSRRKKNVSGWIRPEMDGIYYIGIHGISTCHSGYLFIDNISIDEAMEGTVPDGVTDLTVTSSANGNPEAELVFKAPTVDIAGAPVSGLVTVEVKRDGKLLRIFSDVQPGQELTMHDNTGVEGFYRYTIQSSNATGRGAVVRHDQFVGMGAPMAPSIVSFVDDNAGHAVLTWKAPETDVNGTRIDSSIVTYNIYTPMDDGSLFTEAQGITGNSYSINAPLNEQSLVAAFITATVKGKESGRANTEIIPVGPSYSLPYDDSFTTGGNDYVLAASGDNDVTWLMLDDHSDPDSQDGDNGYLSMIGNKAGQTGEVLTGKIKLDAGRPVSLSFYTYIYEKDANKLRVSVIDTESGKKTELGAVDLATMKTTGWTRLNYSLNEYAGKVVRIVIEASIVSHGYVPIDHMTIRQVPDTDMAVETVNGPSYAEAGAPFDVRAEVHNYGATTANNYQVVLLRDGQEVKTLKGVALAAGERQTMTFTDALPSISSLQPEYTVRVDVEGDANPADNLSKKLVVPFLPPVHPVANNLQAAAEGKNVTLTWDAPDLTKAAPLPVMEDFESYSPLSTQFGLWSTYDQDGGCVGGFKGVDMPGIDGKPQSFWIMPSTEPYSFITPHSGKNVAAQMYVLKSDQSGFLPCDDWLVSPKLYGGMQTISFWAKSFSVQYGSDTFEVYYSTTDNKLESFWQALPTTESSNIWTQYFVTLPPEAKYFAVRCTSSNIYMLMLDDFSFIPEGTPRPITLKGYNVYRNGQQLNKELITDTRYMTTRDQSTDTYFVTAVYDLGESVASDAVRVGETAIDHVALTPNATTAPVEYFDLKGIRVDAQHLHPGVYLRRQGTLVSKVVIK